MAMIQFRAPSLPLPTKDYNQGQQEQFARALRLYFNKIDSTTPLQCDYFLAKQENGSYGYFQGRGDKLINPYGSFFSNTSQTAASTTVAYPITFSNTDLSNGVTLSNSSRMNVTYAGIYNVQFSAQLSNAGNVALDINIWLRKNGVDVANTNSLFGLSARKAVGDPYHTLGALNLFVNLAANDYVELIWSTTDINGSIRYIGTQTSPTRPATPSVIATLSFVSAIP